MMLTTPKYRYPGVNYFTEEDKDIFCGRAEDTQSLYTQIMLCRTVVLHGESGTGKSSLIQAGLVPLLESQNSKYFPVTVRFGNKDDILAGQKNVLVNETISKIKGESKKIALNDKVPYLTNREDDIWYLAKTFERNGYYLLLIFDQFEELQSFSSEQIYCFKQQLAGLLTSDMPEDIYNEIQVNTPRITKDALLAVTDKYEINKNIHFLESPLNTKAIFVVREDKLGTMSLLSDQFPDILKNDFVLKQLSLNNARKAIEGPAEKDGNFFTKQFKFDKAATEKLLKNVGEENINLIDPIQIQIACSSIEKSVAIEKNFITADDIPAMGNIINDFYNDNWDEVKKELQLNEETFEKNRLQIIENLVVNEKRKLVVKDDLIEKGDQGISEKILNILTLNGLLRIIPGKDIYYQLCHDRFIAPLLADKTMLLAKEEAEKRSDKDKMDLEKKLKEAEEIKEKTALANKLYLEKALAAQERKLNKKRIFILTLFSLLLLISTGLAIYYARIALNKEHKTQEENILTTSKLIKKTNPTLSYKIAADWAQINQHSELFDSFLSEFDSSSYSYLTASYSQLSAIISAQYDSNGNLIVADEHGIYVWDRNNSLKDNVPIHNGSILKSLKINNKIYYAVSANDSLEIIDKNGNAFSVFPGGTDTRNVCISNDGNLILIEDVLYDFNSKKELSRLPELKQHDEMASIFLKDNVHIAIGYWSGSIIIYSTLQTVNGGELKPVKMFLGPSVNSVITCLSVDSSGKHIAAGNRESTIQEWEIGDFEDTISLDSVDAKAKRENAVTTLKGHSNYVNYLTYAPDGKTLLSGSVDNTAILWDAGTGKKLSILKGRDAQVTYTNFSDNGSVMTTGTEDGRVFLWKRSKISELYSHHELATFSPFDYYVLNIYRYNAYNLYDTSSIQKLFSGTLNYLSSIPEKNDFPEDVDYLKSLQTSINEVKNLFTILKTNKNFNDSISVVKKRILYNYYNLLVLNEPELLLKGNEDKRTIYDRFSQHHIEDTKRLLLDTTDVSSAIDYAYDFTLMAKYYLDSTSEYRKTFQYLLFEMDSLLKPFLEKYPDNAKLRHREIVANNYMVRYYLYSNHTDSAKLVCDNLCMVSSGTLDGKADMILVYLFSNRFDDAKSVFNELVTENLISKEDLQSYLLAIIDQINSKKIKNSNIDNFKTWLQANKN